MDWLHKYFLPVSQDENHKYNAKYNSNRESILRVDVHKDKLLRWWSWWGAIHWATTWLYGSKKK